MSRRTNRRGDLDGWVTLVNHSGTAYKNASLQLVAGDLHRVIAQNGRDEMKAMAAVAGVANAPAPFQQESFSEYHLYSLNRRTSIFDQESKQISLLNASHFPLRKVYVVNGQAYYYRGAAQPGAPVKDPVQVFYKFKNEEKAGLGMPLPAGTIRVYQQDSRGGSLFAGEDHIDHTPKDEEIGLHIGNAFDIVAERKQTDYKKTFRPSVRIRVRDHAAQSQGRPNLRRSERTDRRRLGDGQLDVQVYEDSRVCSAIRCAH